MTNKQTKDTASIEALITGISAMLVTVLWVAYSPFHPLIILVLYLVALICLSLAVLWYLSEGRSLKAWFVKHPTRFFIVGFIEVFLIVGFLDIFYLYGLFDFGKWENILVEAHGLVFDLFIFGIVLTAYEVIRSKQDKIERYKEELDDYRGWTESEAAYRVAGIIRRLEAEKVEDINFEKLHLGRCPKEIVGRAAKVKAHIISLEGGDLDGADLQGANLEGANLQGASLIEANLKGANLLEANLQRANLWKANLQSAGLIDANLQGVILSEANLQSAYLREANLEGAGLGEANFKRADLEQAGLEKANLWRANFSEVNLDRANLQGAYLIDTNLQGAVLMHANLEEAFLLGTRLQETFLLGVKLNGARVYEADWIEKLKEGGVKGVEIIEARYYVDQTLQKDFSSREYFLIKEKPKG